MAHARREALLLLKLLLKGFEQRRHQADWTGAISPTKPVPGRLSAFGSRLASGPPFLWLPRLRPTGCRQAPGQGKPSAKLGR